MSQKFLWDEDEVLILLDALLQVQSGALSRKNAVMLVSKELRTRAIYRGLTIDDIFRNPNGIHLQMSIMECAYTGGKQGMKQHKVPKLFQDVVSLYENDRPSYKKRVEEAKAEIASANSQPHSVRSAPDAALKLLQKTNIKYVDHRGKGGCLWVTGGRELEPFIQRCREVGITFHYKPDGARSTNGLPAWWTKNCSKAQEILISKSDEAVYTKDDCQPALTHNQNTPTSSDKLLPHFPAELLSAANTILATAFVNGMRKNAVIAQKKFRKAYLSLTSEMFPESVDIDALAAAVSFEYAGKFYTISKANQEKLKRLVIASVNSGNRVMFYEELYCQHMGFMAEAGIFSGDLLKIVLKRILPDMCYRHTFFSPTDQDSLEEDIIDCFGNVPMQTYAEIKGRLLYTDLSQIRLTCSRSDKLVWAKEETYALTDQIRLSQSDIECSMDTISQDIENQGFSVFQRISISESAEQNPDLPETAVREAMYIKHLAPFYEKNHSIITLPGASFSPSSVMVEYCKGLRETTLSELQAYEEALTGRSPHFLSAAYNTMLRVDREHFVSLGAIEFNIHGVDDALSLFVQDNIVPLRSIQSFTSFPEVDGYPWNLFLLESFCRHKSMRFRTMGGPAKSKPVGAIFPLQMQFDSYDTLLAQVAARNGLALQPDTLGDFFTQNAYTLRRIETNRIINLAQEIRIQEGIADV